MPFPKTKSAPGIENQKKALANLRPKKQGDVPLFICEFFEGFEVLQAQGIESQEYIFGIYFSGMRCGHVYFGEKWTQKEAAQICADIMPPTWNQIDEYVNLKSEKAWYWKMHASQYAWVYERVITKK